VALLVLSLRFAATTSAQAAELQEERDVALEVSSFLEGLFEASDPYASGQVRRDTLPLRSFLDDGARRIREGLDSQPLVQARLLSVLGKAWRNLGRFQESRPLLEEALTIREREVGPDSPESAISRSELALLLDDLGEHDDAEELLRSSLEVFERDTVAFARSLATTWGVLGNVLQDNGNFVEAETAYRRAIELADRDSTTTDGRRAEQLSNLATVLSRQANLDEAQSLLEQAVALARTYHGVTHPTTASMLNNLGSVLRSRNELDSAEVVLREALASAVFCSLAAASSPSSAFVRPHCSQV
jgi:serine/threonine-protein kinase